MPSLIAQIPGPHWEPTTPAQKFFKTYVDAVDNKGYTAGSGLRFYSKDSIFHNQNTADYHGADEIWDYIQKAFGAFERIRHDWIETTEIARDDGTTQLITQNTRHLWVKGNRSETPTVSIPFLLIAVVGPSGDDSTPEGLHFNEVWIYWDTALLLPHLPGKAALFNTKNAPNAE